MTITEEQLNKLNKYIRVAIMFKQVGAKINTHEQHYDCSITKSNR